MVVALNRWKCNNKVEYGVVVKKVAINDSTKIYYHPDYSIHKIFSGRERKAAIKYAEKLAAELGAEIIRTGF